ncbi:MAG: DNA-binding protein [Christensenellaceae bacterium]|jgi:predicted DNA-binding protein with PD1-like motif|nr:DNA-binding protein [Christensenellaceae bacterium]
MKEHVFRLARGDDLKIKIEEYAGSHEIEAGIVVCSVGCLSVCTIRSADGKTVIKKTEPLEIISLNGTVSKNGCHLHISVSDIALNIFGGHLKEGCTINTTAEVVIIELESFEFDRAFDKDTGFKELVIKKCRGGG